MTGNTDENSLGYKKNLGLGFPQFSQKKLGFHFWCGYRRSTN